MTKPTIPTFDADSPDAEILEAFEKVRAMRAHAYSFDYLAKFDPAAFERATDELEKFDEDEEKAENWVRRNWATTPSGVAAQLILSVTDGGCDRALDRGLHEHGVRAVYQQREALGLDGHESTLITAAYELIHMEWELALAAYERSNVAFNLILKIADARTSETSEEMRALIDQAEDLLGNNDEVDRVLRTLAPDWTAYQRKAAIAIEETWEARAAPWLVRDVNFLTGVIVIDADEVAGVA